MTTSVASASRTSSRWAWLPRSQLLHLVWVSNLVWQPIFDPTADARDWGLVIGVIVVFVGIFVVSHHPDRRIARGALVATVVLGTATTAVNVGGSVMFVYAGVMAAMQYGPSVARRVLVALTILLAVLAAVSFVPFPYRFYGIVPSAFLLWMIGLQSLADINRERESARLRIDNVRIEQLATAAERERIAQDLHDLLGQSLTGMVIRAQLVQSLVRSDPPAAATHAAQLEEAARDTLRQVRNAVGGLSEVALDDEIDTARRTLDAAGVTVRVSLPEAPGPSPLIERSLALAVREATTNVVRHADATTCTITLDRVGSGWELGVADDGIGGDAVEGNGLRGMRERIAAIGGAVERDGRSGMRVAVTVPG